MSPVYLQKDSNGQIRKVMLDMAYLVSHKTIRLPKYLYEDELFISYFKDPKSKKESDKYFLTNEKIVNKDNNFYYFNFPFKDEQIIKYSY